MFAVTPFQMRECMAWTIAGEGGQHGNKGKLVSFKIMVADNFRPDQKRRCYGDEIVSLPIEFPTDSLPVGDMEEAIAAAGQIAQIVSAGNEQGSDAVRFLVDQLLLWDYKPLRKKGDDPPGIEQVFSWDTLTNYQSVEQAQAAGMTDEWIGRNTSLV